MDQQNPNPDPVKASKTDKTIATLLVSSYKVTGPDRDHGHKITFEVGEDSSLEVAKLFMISPDTVLRVRVEVLE